MSDVEERLRRLEDRAALQDLIVRYFVAADDDDYETLGACFADDGAFSAGGFPGGTTRQEIVDFIRADRESMAATVHTPDFLLLDFEGDDAATGVVGAHLELGRGGTTLFGAVRYFDRYARGADGRWQITSREMRTKHVGPWDEVASSLTSKLSVRWPGIDPLPAEV
ncbi:MAG TPA: nuclear transport factor 2 family protein [Baekduia sp.]|nr:nuclear transport factor 2 family protein [Baekduia sp.]